MGPILEMGWNYGGEKSLGWTRLQLGRLVRWGVVSRVSLLHWGGLELGLGLIPQFVWKCGKGFGPGVVLNWNWGQFLGWNGGIGFGRGMVNDWKWGRKRLGCPINIYRFSMVFPFEAPDKKSLSFFSVSRFFFSYLTKPLVGWSVISVIITITIIFYHNYYQYCYCK